MLQPTTPLEEVADHNVIRYAPGEGAALMIGDWPLIWKAEGKDTGYAFSIYECELAPGQGIPLHKHPYAEFFYVLEGDIAFSRWDTNGVAEWLSCPRGASVVAPPMAPHTFQNRSTAPARMLSVSTHHHERMLKDAVTPGGKTDFLPRTLTPQVFDSLFKSMEDNQVFVVAEKAE